MEVKWEAITSISTVFLTLFTLGLMLATIWLAVIALQAKNTWKDELRQRNRLEAVRNANTLLSKLQESIVVFHGAYLGEQFMEEYWAKLDEAIAEIPNVIDELLAIGCQEISDVFQNLAKQFLYLVEIDSTGKVLVRKDLINLQDYKEQKYKYLSDKREELGLQIEKLKELCHSEINKFYKK